MFGATFGGFLTLLHHGFGLLFIEDSLGLLFLGERGGVGGGEVGDVYALTTVNGLVSGAGEYDDGHAGRNEGEEVEDVLVLEANATMAAAAAD